MRNFALWKCQFGVEGAFMVIALLCGMLIFKDLTDDTGVTAFKLHPRRIHPHSGAFGKRKKLHPTREPPRGVETCSSAECIHTASTILSNMDPNVDPCDNFYKYACGGFVNATIIPDDKSAITAFSVTADKLDEQLRKSVEVKSGANEPKSYRLAKNLYQSCMNETAIEARGLEPLREYLEKLGGWPVVVGTSWKEDDFDWKNITYKLYETGDDPSYLIAYGVTLDAKNSSKRVLAMSQASLGISREYLTKGIHDKIVSAYYSYMVDIATMLGADNESAKRELSESLDFEIKLANISLPKEEFRNETKLYNPMRLPELTKNYPNVPWKDYFSRLLPSTTILKEDEVVIVYVPSYVTNLLKLLDETKPRVLANYLMWRITQGSISFLNEDIRKRQLAYSTVLSGRTKSAPRWKTCIGLLGNAFPTVIGSMYVRKYFNEDAKKSAIEMVTDIREQFTETLKNIPWMDNETRQKALEKAKSMYSHIGYPNELLDIKKIDNIYRKLNELSEDKYFENIFKTSVFINDRQMSDLRKPVNKTDWESHGYAAIVNAFYSPNENSILFPAGILQGAFFSNNRPSYMNYGGIGSVIGHEITHGFDDQGRQFDKDGNVVDWWTATTTNNFLKRAQCIIDQYGNYTVEEIGHKLNGIHTQGENIADNGGIKVAYRAYKKWVARNGPEPRLPGIDMNPNQLFWISAANVWCSKYRMEALKLQIIRDPHAPKEFRVVGPLSNLEEFSKDFHCPRGSKMNPTNKCSVW